MTELRVGESLFSSTCKLAEDPLWYGLVSWPAGRDICCVDCGRLRLSPTKPKGLGKIKQDVEVQSGPVQGPPNPLALGRQPVQSSSSI